MDLSDIEGSEKLKSILLDNVVSPLKDDSGDAVRRIIIYGPPGTGKTYLARAVAGELGLNLKIIRYNDESQVVSDTIQPASKDDLIYFDSVEYLRYRPVLMDALKSIPEDVLVVGATNFPWKITSLSKEGFDCLVFMAEPGQKARSGIFRQNLQGREDSFDFEELANLTEGFVAVDIWYLCEWVQSKQEVTQDALVEHIRQFPRTQLNDWIDEVRIHAKKLDKTLYAELHDWLKDKRP